MFRLLRLVSTGTHLFPTIFRDYRTVTRATTVQESTEKNTCPRCQTADHNQNAKKEQHVSLFHCRVRRIVSDHFVRCCTDENAPREVYCQDCTARLFPVHRREHYKWRQTREQQLYGSLGANFGGSTVLWRCCQATSPRDQSQRMSIGTPATPLQSTTKAPERGCRTAAIPM